MPEVADSPAPNCYGCVHLGYRGPAEVKGRLDLTGGTAIRLREEDGQNGPGSYACSKLEQRIGLASKPPRPLVAGGACKETR